MICCDVLRRWFKDAVKSGDGYHRGVFLDLFSGDGHVSKQLRREGFPVINIDIVDDPRFDLTDKAVLDLIIGWIVSGCILGVWLATVCTSWSQARHGPIGSSWGPIRDDQHIYGLPNLRPSDQEKIRFGNATMRATCRIITACIQNRIACFLENPAGSMMWKAPPLVKLCSHHCSLSFVCDFCQYGARWRKRTRIQGWNVQTINDLNHTCSGRGGVCSRNGSYHIVLKGQDPTTRQLWTHLAQPYPVQFAKAAAKALIHSYDTLQTFNLRHRFGL